MLRRCAMLQDVPDDTGGVDCGQILVTSDLAMRGIDFQGASHVVIFDFPSSAAEYIHMAGRTARAGADGALCSFACLPST